MRKTHINVAHFMLPVLKIKLIQMRKLKLTPRQKQRISFKQIAVASSLGMAALAIGFTVFNSGMLQSEKAVANNDKKLNTKAFIEQGDELFYSDFPEYEQAIPHYEQAIKTEPANAELNYKLGVCYLNSHNKFKAKDYLLHAEELDPKIEPVINFYIGRSYHIHAEFDKAIAAYTKFLGTENTELHVQAKKLIAECENGKELIKHPVNISVQNLGAAVNSMYPDYAPYISSDENLLLFTSRRPDTYGGKSDDFDGVYFEDIYESTQKGAVWQQAKNAGEPVNTPTHDAVAGISADGKTMFVFKGDRNDGDILVSKLDKGVWSTPASIGKNINSKYHESTATLSADGNTLYFISDRPGAAGGRDIFKSTWDAAKSEWMKPENAGAEINTPYDEEGVFLHPDGNTLYFSSKGHNTMGGYDIFVSKLENGVWQKPVNIGYPINSPDDDVFFTVSKNGHAYYTSIQKDGYGDKDVYKIMFDGGNLSSEAKK